MKRFFRKWWWILLLVPLLALTAFIAWAETPLGPMPEAERLFTEQTLQSAAEVQVLQKPWIVFRPAGEQPTTGLIFYPGGRVDPRAYAPAARAIAGQGYLVAIVPMPLNLAVFGSGQAGEVIAALPEIEHWVVGGHSLGGAMAANFARKNTAQVDGLVLWAAYPSSSDDLSAADLRVTLIYGTLDGLSTENKIDASRPLLPPDTRWLAIEGGNHAQFGWYGNQPGDQAASISQEAQQQPAIQATVDLLKTVEGGIP